MRIRDSTYRIQQAKGNIVSITKYNNWTHSDIRTSYLQNSTHKASGLSYYLKLSLVHECSLRGTTGCSESTESSGSRQLQRDCNKLPTIVPLSCCL